MWQVASTCSDLAKTYMNDFILPRVDIVFFQTPGHISTFNKSWDMRTRIMPFLFLYLTKYRQSVLSKYNLSQFLIESEPNSCQDYNLEKKIS